MPTDGNAGFPTANGTIGTGPGTPPDGLPPGVPPIPSEIIITPWAAYCARIYIVSTSILLVLVMLTFSTRLYQRMRPVWKVGLDDYFIVLGFILSVADWGMLLPAMIPQPTVVPLSYGAHTGKHSWLAISVWGLSMTCIKISIALTLLRIQGKSLRWRIFLFSIMGMQALYGILNVFFNLVIACRPLAKAWDILAPGSCVDYATMRLVSNIGSAINITTDVLLSLAPGVFLRNLNRPLRERIFVCVLMGLGLFASVSSILKTVIVQKFGRFDIPDDFWAQGIAISTYTVLEQFTGLLAACVPAMKGTFQACLGKMGVSLSGSRSRPGRSGYYIYNSGGTASAVRSPFGTQTGASQPGSRYVSGGKDDSLDEDEEKCLEMPERRHVATPKSSHGSASFREDFKGGVTSMESAHLPRHGV